MKHKVFTLKPDLYPIYLTFCVGQQPTVAEAKRHCANHLWKVGSEFPNDLSSLAFTLTFGSGCYIWVPRTRHEHHHQGFAHEMVHVLTWISHLMGQPMNKESDEFHAYLAGWIAKEFYRKIK